MLGGPPDALSGSSHHLRRDVRDRYVRLPAPWLSNVEHEVATHLPSIVIVGSSGETPFI